MTKVRDNFALDWIKGDLVKALDEARYALDAYAEQGNEEQHLRPCLTALHRVHGTLVMLDLTGVTQLADHLEQLCQAMLERRTEGIAGAPQALMQGIIELPGYLDELHSGTADSPNTGWTLVNEIRGLLQLPELAMPAGDRRQMVASDEAIERFVAIGGLEKVARIRAAFQSVLLGILKGQDRYEAMQTLSKISLGLEKVCENTPLNTLWQAFAEFVTSLKLTTGALDAQAIKLLRRLDLEIKNLASGGEAMLRQPVNLGLAQALLDSAIERKHASARVTELRAAVTEEAHIDSLAIHAKQALSAAAELLQEELSVLKGRLDLLVRGDRLNVQELAELLDALKKIASTLSMLGFESSVVIVSDQVKTVEQLLQENDLRPDSLYSVAAALAQIDESLGSISQASSIPPQAGITSDAQRQLVHEARGDIDRVKQAMLALSPCIGINIVWKVSQRFCWN